jgi:copper(I)-binding protein
MPFLMSERESRRTFVVGALTCLLSAVPTWLTASSSLLSIQTPWCLAARPGANAAGYLVIDNKGFSPDRLTAITSAAAQRVSIHESRVTGGVATMTSLDGVGIPARTAVTFGPGGLHLMLEMLRRPLSVGERVPITLWFKVAGPVRTSLVIMLHPPISARSSMRM